MSSISKLIWFDGKFVKHSNAKIPVTTHAIHYGTSIFEGIRAYWNGEKLNIFRLNEHITRFRNSGKFYDITLRFSNREIKDAIINLCKKNKIKTSCYIRPFYFVGQYGINLHVTKKAPTHAVVFCFPFGDLFNKNGITTCISKWKKFNDSSTPTQAKMGGNYLNSILITGVISAAVPVRKTSSAYFNSSFVISLIFDFIFILLENANIDFLVIPSNADDESGGVINVLFFTIKIFSPGASLTLLSLSNKIDSSNFLLFASCVAKIEFR